MTQVTPSEAPAGFRDRSLGLIIYGMAELALAALVALLGLVSLGGMVMMRAMPTPMSGMPDYPVATMAAGVATYFLIAAFFVVVGVGSFLARRWACAVMLAVSWIWLVMGAVSVMAWLAMLPRFDDYMAAVMANTPGQAVPAGFLGTMTVFMTLFMGVLHLAMPLAFLLFYRSGHVQATCAWRDPVPRWTDRLSVPLLAVVILHGASVPVAFLAVSYGFFPLFGRPVQGFAAAALWLAAGLAMLWIARGLSRHRMAAWWAALVLSVVLGASWLTTLARTGMVEINVAMGMPARDAQAVVESGLISDTGLIAFTAVMWAAWLAFLLWLRSHIHPQGPEGQGA